MTSIKRLVEIIHQHPQKTKTKLIAVDGVGGSGKSTLVKKIIKIDPTIKIAELDKFPYLPEEHPYHPLGAQTRVNIPRFIREVMQPLSDGKTAKFTSTFWWKTDQLPETISIKPGGTVVVEGCYSFHKDIRDYYDYSIWVECEAVTATERAIKRDGEDGRVLWEKVHAPNERRYVSVQKPQQAVDLVISNKHNFVQ